jgi:hypothetical protein
MEIEMLKQENKLIVVPVYIGLFLNCLPSGFNGQDVHRASRRFFRSRVPTRLGAKKTLQESGI